MNRANDTNDPVVAMISGLLDWAGLYHSHFCLADEQVLIEVKEGVDYNKAIRISVFADAISGGTGIINQSTIQKNLLSARRELLKHVVHILEKQGAEFKCEEELGGTVDWAYHFVAEGKNISFFLMSE